MWKKSILKNKYSYLFKYKISLLTTFIHWFFTKYLQTFLKFHYDIPCTIIFLLTVTAAVTWNNFYRTDTERTEQRRGGNLFEFIVG